MSDLDGNPEDRFSRSAAHNMYILGCWINIFDLVQLRLIVKGHQGHIVLGGVSQEGGLLTGVGVDDTTCRHTLVQYLLDFSLQIKADYNWQKKYITLNENKDRKHLNTNMEKKEENHTYDTTRQIVKLPIFRPLSRRHDIEAKNPTRKKS